MYWKESITFFISKCETVSLRYWNNPKVFIEYLSVLNNFYKNIDKYSAVKENRILIVFDDMLSNKKLQVMVTKPFIRSRKTNNYLVFITQS